MAKRGTPIFDAVSAQNLLLPPQGRLTLATGTSRMTSSVTGAAAVLYTPDVGALCPVWDPVNGLFVAVPFTETSQALSDITKSPAAASQGQIYDKFGWLDGTTFRVTRGPAWVNGATPGSNAARGSGAGSTALTRVGGLYVNRYDITNGPAAGCGTFLGTVATDANGATVSWTLGSAAAGGGAAMLGVWNAFNPDQVVTTVRDTTGSWSYSTAKWRALNGSANNSVTYVTGLPLDAVTAHLTLRVGLASSAGYLFGPSTVIDTPNIGAQADLYSTAGTQYLSLTVPGAIKAQGLATITAIEFASTGATVAYGGTDEALIVGGRF